ncbi:MAG: hypothetical protein K6A31_10220 [Fibrobacter sp.]|nr:hypothetical protein [Fibrobacter sp.]
MSILNNAKMKIAGLGVALMPLASFAQTTDGSESSGTASAATASGALTEVGNNLQAITDSTGTLQTKVIALAVALAAIVIARKLIKKFFNI